MAEPTGADNAIFGADHWHCPETGRPYERGHGALSPEAQTRNFLRERDRLADLPSPGERCPQTGREYEFGSGAHTRAAQSERFVSELPAAERQRRAANAAALAAVIPAGSA